MRRDEGRKVMVVGMIQRILSRSVNVGNDVSRSARWRMGLVKGTWMRGEYDGQIVERREC